MAQSVFPVIGYEDIGSALKWLADAFGFEPAEVSRTSTGEIIHAEMRVDNDVIMLSRSRSDVQSGSVYVCVTAVDDHFARAKARGAEITMEPTDMEYGSREYAARDPEGHQWYFGTYRPA